MVERGKEGGLKGGLHLWAIIGDNDINQALSGV